MKAKQIMTALMLSAAIFITGCSTQPAPAESNSQTIDSPTENTEAPDSAYIAESMQSASISKATSTASATENNASASQSESAASTELATTSDTKTITIEENTAEENVSITEEIASLDKTEPIGDESAVIYGFPGEEPINVADLPIEE